MLAAAHLVDGSSEGLPRQVPEGHFHSADATPLPAMMSKLLDSLEDAFDVAGVLVQETALEHERVARAASVPDFTVTLQSLVGVDPDDRHPHRSPLDQGDAKIRDPEVRWLGVSIDALRGVGDL